MPGGKPAEELMDQYQGYGRRQQPSMFERGTAGHGLMRHSRHACSSVLPPVAVPVLQALRVSSQYLQRETTSLATPVPVTSTLCLHHMLVPPANQAHRRTFTSDFPTINYLTL